MPDIQVQIGAQFPHPPLQFLSMELISGGPYTAGDHTFTRPGPGGVVPVSAFGFVWSIEAEPLNVGIIYGIVPLYERRVCQVVVHHRLLSGDLINTAVIDAHTFGFTLFDTFPGDVEVLIETGFECDFWWLVLL